MPCRRAERPGVERAFAIERCAIEITGVKPSPPGEQVRVHHPLDSPPATVTALPFV